MQERYLPQLAVGQVAISNVIHIVSQSTESCAEHAISLTRAVQILSERIVCRYH